MDKKILIADAGGTKTAWMLVAGNGDVLADFCTAGINAATSADVEVSEILTIVNNRLSGVKPDVIWFYGAGCASSAICSNLKRGLESILGGEAHVESDLLAAARGLLGHDSGVVCILGTGSNSGYYNGEKITVQVPSLGFILGDEGSGTALGKRLLRDALRRELPDDLMHLFETNYPQTDISYVIERVYRKPGANAFIASYVPFLKQNESHPYVIALLEEEFAKFAKLLKTGYGDRLESVAFIGGIAGNFSNILKGELLKVGITECRHSENLLYLLKDYHCHAKE